MSEDTCSQHSAHERAIGVHDQRLNAHSQQLDSIRETLAALEIIERQNQERIDALDDRVDALESVPANRWNTVTNYALTAFVGAVLGLILANVGII